MRPTRRSVLAGALAATAFAARPSAAQQLPVFGPPPHKRGPLVFLNYDQVELDAAYDQSVYEPNIAQVVARLASNSDATRLRIGQPKRMAYGPTDVEKLDIYSPNLPKAPVFMFIHGGGWQSGSARDSGYMAEVFVSAGAHCVLPDYVLVQHAGGSLAPMVDQLRRAVAWVYKNAAGFGGDPDRIYLAGHSAGGHLAGLVLTTDWEAAFNLPPDIIKGGICASGMYDLEPVRLSSRRNYVRLDDAAVAALSPQRRLRNLWPPIIVAYGTFETPEFQRQGRDFAAAAAAAGKSVQLVVAENYAHVEVAESFGNPYGVMGRVVLEQMQLR